MSTATRRRMLPRLRRSGGRGDARGRGRRLRIGPRTVAGLLVLVALLVGAFFWVRQSSLVAVRTVTITGVSGPDASQIRSGLAGAARGMSTLDVDAHRLRAVVAPYPVVRGLRLHTDFPHGLRIAVSEQVPVAVLVAGSTRTIVATDGALLRTSHVSSPLPTIAVPVAPGGTHVAGAAATEVGLLTAAPYPLLARIASAGPGAGGGLAVRLRQGPTIEFGDDSQLPAKWSAAVAVLASRTSAGASYIDVSVPSRPAAGAGSDTAPTSTTPATTGDTTTTSPSGTG